MQTAARSAVQNIHHTAADITDIHTAFPDIIIIDIAQAPGKNLFGALHRRRAACSGCNIVANLIGERVIFQQCNLEHQNIRILPAGVLL